MNYRAILLAGCAFAGAMSVVGMSAGMAAWSPNDADTAVEVAGEITHGGENVEFSVDPVHSSVVFSIKHSGVSRFYGRFSKVSGSFSVDPEDGAISAVRVEIPAESIDTNSSGRDRHLKGTDFFDAKQYPTLSFVSSKVECKEGNVWSVTGDFGLHGVTKSMTVEVEVTGHKKGQQGYLGGIASNFKVNRSEFGMLKYLDNGGLGDEVTIMVGLEGRAE